MKLGRVAGYLSSAVLHPWWGMDLPFLPPICTTPAETALYAVPDAQSDVLQTVPLGTTLEVLGVYDAQGFYHVRWGALDAFVPKEALPHAPQRSRETPPANADGAPYVLDPLLSGYRTLYIARPNTALRDSPSPDGAILHTFDGGGYQAMLLGGVLPSGYVRVLCQTDLFFEKQKSPPIEGYLPVDALTWDSGY